SSNSFSQSAIGITAPVGLPGEQTYTNCVSDHTASRTASQLMLQFRAGSLGAGIAGAGIDHGLGEGEQGFTRTIKPAKPVPRRRGSRRSARLPIISIEAQSKLEGKDNPNKSTCCLRSGSVARGVDRASAARPGFL